MLSDLHGELPVVDLCDIVVIAGDVCPIHDHTLRFQERWLRKDFAEWIRLLPTQYVVWIAGNHDFVLENRLDLGREIDEYTKKSFYLRDSAVDINGILFYGTPWSTEFGNWAFMRDDFELQHIYTKINPETNVLVSHGPPRGFGDKTIRGSAVGSYSLLERIQEVKPTIVVTGHIHEARGIYVISEFTKIYNASYVNINYKPYGLPSLHTHLEYRVNKPTNS